MTTLPNINLVCYTPQSRKYPGKVHLYIEGSEITLCGHNWTYAKHIFKGLLLTELGDDKMCTACSRKYRKLADELMKK